MGPPEKKRDFSFGTPFEKGKRRETTLTLNPQEGRSYSQGGFSFSMHLDL
jgi:hypothetical protein